MNTLERIKEIRKGTLDRLECAETEEERMLVLRLHDEVMIKMLQEEGII